MSQAGLLGSLKDETDQVVHYKPVKPVIFDLTDVRFRDVGAADPAIVMLPSGGRIDACIWPVVGACIQDVIRRSRIKSIRLCAMRLTIQEH